MSDWQALAAELELWPATGREATFWWRDDDAASAGDDLARLFALARETGQPLALAVIGGLADASLFAVLADHTDKGAFPLDVLVHGFRHLDHAPAGEKKCEFPASRLMHEMLADVAISWEGLRLHLGDLAVPVFVPPWNRISELMLPRLVNANMVGLSRFGPRAAAEPAPGLREINVHADLVDWGRGEAFVGETRALTEICQHLRARRLRQTEPDEATGILSHHLRMDAPTWQFLARLLDFLAEQPGARLCTARYLFGMDI